MYALVLVGGEGTRLRPLTYDVPKPMLPVLGRPMIARIIEWLARHGVEHLVFSLAYRADAFITAFPTGSWAGVELTYAVEPEPLDTAGAIRYAALAAGVADNELIICNGDILTNLDLTSLVDTHHRAHTSATISLAPVEDPSAYGVAITAADGRITAFVEKPPAGTAPSNLVNIGTYVFAPGLVHEIPAGRRVSIEREIFPLLVERGAIGAYVSSPYWLDTGTPGRFITAQLDILRDAGREIELDHMREVAPGRFIGTGCVLSGTVDGVAFIGPGARIASGAVVRDAVIGPGVVIGANAQVEQAVLLENAELDEGANVTCSIVGAGASVGARAVIRAESIVGNRAIVAADALLDSARLPV